MNDPFLKFKPTHPNLIRKEIVSLEEVLPFVSFSFNKKEVKRIYNGDMIKMGSLRYQVFALKGLCCVSCGIKGEYFAKEKNPKDKSYHLNLYGKTSTGDEVMLTKDHIIPKSLGGLDTLDNLQTMCKVCNEAKGNGINQKK